MNLKELRKLGNLKQKDVAEFLGVSVTGYANKENGLRQFKTHEAIKLSSLFGVPIDEVENFLPNSPQVEDKITA